MPHCCLARLIDLYSHLSFSSRCAGAYVSLLEYDNIEGMIPLTELSNRRIRSFHKLIRVGRVEIVVVTRVDKEKGAFSCKFSESLGDDIVHGPAFASQR